MESVAVLIREVTNQYLLPQVRLATKGSAGRPPMVGWTFGITNTQRSDLIESYPETYVLTFSVLHQTSPCHDEAEAYLTPFMSLYSVTTEAVTNALFHALSRRNSPYWFNGVQWDRKRAIYG